MHKNFENKKYQKVTNLFLKFKKYYYLGNIIVCVRTQLVAQTQME